MYVNMVQLWYNYGNILQLLLAIGSNQGDNYN